MTGLRRTRNSENGILNMNATGTIVIVNLIKGIILMAKRATFCAVPSIGLHSIVRWAKKLWREHHRNYKMHRQCETLTWTDRIVIPANIMDTPPLVGSVESSTLSTSPKEVTKKTSTTLAQHSWWPRSASLVGLSISCSSHPRNTWRQTIQLPPISVVKY